MKAELFKHKLAYIVLTSGLLFLVVLFLASWPNVFAQRVVIGSIALFYFSWGIITHVFTRTLSSRITLEYGLVSLLGAVILGALTV